MSLHLTAALTAPVVKKKKKAPFTEPLSMLVRQDVQSKDVLLHTIAQSDHMRDCKHVSQHVCCPVQEERVRQLKKKKNSSEVSPNFSFLL